MPDLPKEKPIHLKPSDLGTKEYWDNLYQREISNHVHNPGDEGTVWFDDSDAEGKMVEYMSALVIEKGIRLSPSSPQDDNDDLEDRQKKSASFLDLGTGNGSLLLALREDGWKGEMLGVDYSTSSVSLAKQVQEVRLRHHRQESEEEFPSIRFQAWDILRGDISSGEVGIFPGPSKGKHRKWDVVLDKGTFDAISLSDITDIRGRRVVEGYHDRVLPLVRCGGRFLITSCNWTEAELRKWFEGSSVPSPESFPSTNPVKGYKSSDDEGKSLNSPSEEDDSSSSRFVFEGRIDYPSFRFGGVKGQTITSICFRKELRH